MYCDGAERDPRPGHARFAAASLHSEGDAEIGEQRFTVLEEDVLGLDVAMEHALAMREVQRAGDLLRDANRVGDRKLLSRASRSRRDSPA